MFSKTDTALRHHFFWKWAFKNEGLFLDINVNQSIASIDSMVRYMYLFFLFLIVERFNYIEDIQQAVIVAPLWPVFWLKYVNFKAAINIIMMLLFAAFLGVSIAPYKLWLRIVSFISFFVYTAAIYSFGKISHVYHLLLVVLFFFVFLTYKKEEKSHNILVIASLQFFILVTYSFTGLWKLLAGFVQFFRGEVSLFSFSALENIIENQFAINNQELPYFTSWILENQLLGHVFLWGAVVIELLSVLVFFKAALHRVWGVLLICLHAGIALVLDVNFYVAPMLIGVFFLFSPFYKESKLSS